MRSLAQNNNGSTWCILQYFISARGKLEQERTDGNNQTAGGSLQCWGEEGCKGHVGSQVTPQAVLPSLQESKVHPAKVCTAQRVREDLLDVE
jgi:hypothetical protein